MNLSVDFVYTFQIALLPIQSKKNRGLRSINRGVEPDVNMVAINLYSFRLGFMGDENEPSQRVDEHRLGTRNMVNKQIPRILKLAGIQRVYFLIYFFFFEKCSETNAFIQSSEAAAAVVLQRKVGKSFH